jgi:tRNA G18 (ribose-2'-O)-methylase SpoU
VREPGEPEPGEPEPGEPDARDPQPRDGVGVGPWPGPWPDDPRLDPELLAAGDRRNVADRYRYWRVEAVRADLDTRRHPVHVAVENLRHDLNIGSVVRTANAVNVAAVHVVGRRRWNRRGAMVTDRYLHVVHHPDAAALAGWAADRGLPLLGVDNTDGAVPLETYDLPAACVLVLGQEGSGLSPEAAAACRDVLAIAQFGSTRSVNVGAAAAVVLHAWVRRHVFGQRPS